MITHITVEEAAKLISRIAGTNETHALTYIREAADRGEIQAATALSTLQAENKRLNKIVCSIPTTPDSGRTVSQYDKEISMCAYLDDLEAENEKLRAELEQVKHALAMMWFAYVNSDKETPHSYETEAIEEAERLLGHWEECMPKYLWRGIKEG